ncbi:MAG TPA: hypothetical protein VKU19_35105 [Bryobacteraceae bacterium]|nr:hypothetical protein [Bryobacteraceae bacterium]
MMPFAPAVVRVHLSIEPNVAVFAALAGLVMAAFCLSSLSWYALLRAKALVRRTEQKAKTGQERCEALLESLRQSHDTLAEELRELRDQPPPLMPPGILKPGLNLTTRSQALRMHRHGESPDRIAAALNVPFQEVDLLLKVHRIVITNI